MILVCLLVKSLNSILLLESGLNFQSGSMFLGASPRHTTFGLLDIHRHLFERATIPITTYNNHFVQRASITVKGYKKSFPSNGYHPMMGGRVFGMLCFALCYKKILSQRQRFVNILWKYYNLLPGTKSRSLKTYDQVLRPDTKERME